MTKPSHCSLSQLVLSFLIFGTALPCGLPAQQVSLDDVVSGLEVFESRLSEMACNYTIEFERSDLYKKLNPGKTWEHKVSSFDLLLERDRRVASTQYRIEDKKPEYRVVFDGEKVQAIQYLLDSKETSGSHASMAPRTAVGSANALMNREDAMPSVGPFFLMEPYKRRASSWSEFLRNGPPAGELKECVLAKVLQQEGDITCVVRMRFFEGNVYYTETITLNASKSFWPERILLEIESVDSEDVEEFPISVLSELTVHGLKTVSDFAIPTSIQKTDYAAPFQSPGIVDLPRAEKIIEEAICDYHSIDFEPSFSDDDFNIEFPPNSIFVDRRDDETYLVDGAGNKERVLALTPDRYTKEEAFKLLREERLGKQQNSPQSDGAHALRYGLTLLGIGVLLVALVTWYRRGT